jgi:hypothetical protein
MLGPHDRENAELDEVRLTAKRVQDSLIFVRAQPMLFDDLRSDTGSFDNVHARRLSGRGQLRLVSKERINEPSPPCCVGMAKVREGEQP